MRYDDLSIPPISESGLQRNAIAAARVVSIRLGMRLYETKSMKEVTGLSNSIDRSGSMKQNNNWNETAHLGLPDKEKCGNLIFSSDYRLQITAGATAAIAFAKLSSKRLLSH